MRQNGESGDGGTRLALVFVQHDRKRYRRALARLIAAIGDLEAQTTFVVVDNAVAGDWTHDLSDGIFHIGGDNSAWEFSAFDRGLAWLDRQGRKADVYALATDALLAYGEEFLELVDDRVLDWCLRSNGCVGWIDSFMERCEILGHSYDAWLRTSLLFFAGPLLPSVRPLAHDLREGEIFGPGPSQPFRPGAPLSRNLQRLLLEWLTTNGVDAKTLDEGWHSQFRLDPSSFPRFKAKVKSILREQLLSARLQSLGVPCYDLRAVRAASDLGVQGEALNGEAAVSWQWLGWRQAEARTPRSGLGVDLDVEASADPLSHLPRTQARRRERRRAPTFLLAAPERRDQALAAVRFFQSEVLPLVAQRHAGPRLALAGAHAELIADLEDDDGALVAWPGDAAQWGEAVALLLPPAAAARREDLEAAAARGLPSIGVWPGDTSRPAADGRHYLRAERRWEYATACCRLIEEPELRDRLADGARELSPA